MPRTQPPWAKEYMQYNRMAVMAGERKLRRYADTGLMQVLVDVDRDSDHLLFVQARPSASGRPCPCLYGEPGHVFRTLAISHKSLRYQSESIPL